MSLRHNNTIGALFVSMYVLVSTMGAVYTASMLEKISADSVLVVSITITMLFFVVSSTISGRWYAIEKSHFPDVFMLNIFTAGGWIGMFYALKNLEPAIVNALLIGISPIFTLLSNSILRKNSATTTPDIIACIGIFIASIFLVWAALAGHSSLTNRESAEIIFGLSFAVISGVSISLTTIYSKRLHEKKMQTNKIMANRFYLLILFAFAFSGSEEIAQSVYQYPIEIILITLLSVGLPVYLIQLGVNRSEPIFVEMIIAVSPAITFGLQIFDPRLGLSMYTFIGVLILTMFGGMSILFHFREEKV